MTKTTKKAKGKTKAPLKDMTATRAKKIKGGQAKSSHGCFGGFASYRLH